MERLQKYFNRLYRAAILDRAAAFQKYGLSGPQISYVLHLCRQPGLTQDELAASLFVGKSSVARQVAALETLGFLTREIDDKDRRIRHCFPTAKAEALYPEVMAYLESWNDALTMGLSEDEGRRLAEHLRRLSERATARVKSNVLAGVFGGESGTSDA